MDCRECVPKKSFNVLNIQNTKMSVSIPVGHSRNLDGGVYHKKKQKGVKKGEY